MKKQFGMFVALVLLSGVARAALPPKEDSIIKTLENESLPDRLDVLRSHGKDTYRQLRTTAFDPNQDLKVRWKALMSMAMIGKDESLRELEQAAQSPDWFMRDASLKAMARVTPPSALKWARKLISDPSLVVRTSAVMVLKQFRDRSSASLLWEKLYAPENFRGSQSLWIRRHIVEALAAIKPAHSEDKFLKLFDDPDTRLYEPAVLGLETVTGVKLGMASDDIGMKKNFWRRWAAQNPSKLEAMPAPAAATVQE